MVWMKTVSSLDSKSIDSRWLVLPDAGNAGLQQARNHYLKKTVWQFLRLRTSFPRDSDPSIARVLKFALARDPAKTLSVFASPNIGTATHCYANRRSWPRFSDRIKNAFWETTPRILLELAIRNLLPDQQINWPHGTAALASPSIDILLQAPEARGWIFENDGVAALESFGRGPSVRLSARSLTRGRRSVKGLRSELAYIPLEGSIRLALVDHSPIAEGEAHPDKSGNAWSLGGHSEDDWRTSLQTALQWIRDHMPELFAEMDLLLRQIVPVGYDPEKHFSASFKDAIGTIYMTLHPNVLTMAEAIIHEFQHNKLNLISYGEEILNNAFSPLYPSPVRPDPRPLWGVLLAVHAFLPVAVFYRKLRAVRHPASLTPDFMGRLNEIDLKNREGMNTLRSHADWTLLGRKVMDELETLDRRHMNKREGMGLSVVPWTVYEGHSS